MKKQISRRTFLKGTAGLAAASLLGACASNECEDVILECPPGNDDTTSASTGDWLTDAKEQIFAWRKKPKEPTTFANEYEADVVVVGAGFAGLNATRRSLELGNSVAVIEKDDTYDVHGFECGVLNPSMLTKQGYKVDETEFFNAYMAMHNNRCNPDLVRLFTYESGKAFDWYEEILPPVGDDASTNYRNVVYFPRPEGWSNENHKYKTFVGAVDFTYASWAYAGKILYDTTVSKGAEYHFNETAYCLHKDGSRVTAVITTNADGSYNKYTAKKGVIISTGYAGTDPNIMREIGVEEAMYSLRNGQDIPAFSGFGGTGDGHRMLVWEGAEIEPFRQADGCALSLLDQ